MELHRMAASFGRLEGEELRLHPGLNIIEAPNEAGKSTWAAFLRSMLYGVSTSERSKNGSLPDKKHYQPWSGAPMAGEVELRWRDQELTLRRGTANATRPMGEFSAVYTGTGDPVPELKKGVPGEVLLGVPEAVFRRSAFISGAALTVDANAELEKRILQLVTSGEERTSYTEADGRLRRWQRKRRWRNSGAWPETEAQRHEVQQKLYRIEGENKRLAGLRAEKEELTEQAELLRQELRLHKRDERRALRAQQEKAQRDHAAAVEEAAQAARTVAELRGQAGDRNREQIFALREADVRWREAEADRQAAQRRWEERSAALEGFPEPQPGKNPRKAAVLACFVPGLICLLLGLVAGMGLLSLSVGGVYGLIVAGLGLLLLASLLLAAGRRQVRAALVEAQHRRALMLQAASEAEQQLKDCTRETEECREVRSKALSALGAAPDADAEETALAVEELLRRLRDAVIISENAEKLAQRLETPPMPPMEPIPEDALEGETRLGKAAAEDYLLRTEERLRSVSRELDRGEGLFELLGDPMVLATEEARLGERAEDLQQEYGALELAAETLRRANARLQTLFSPLISREAAALLARMTGSSYAGVYFDREMRFSAQRSGELDARALEYLSEGTRSQLYLAVRLAMCRLLLSEEEPCPLILDDVLLSFDDRRAKETLRLLRELSRERQILLFTCQSREQRLLGEMEEEECLLP